MHRKSLYLSVVLLVLAAAMKVSAQGTMFSYEGRLNTNGVPANNTMYDLRFALYDAVVNGNQISGPVTNVAVGVTNGLFATTIDFGMVFTGTNYWLSVGVRTNGPVGNTNNFTILAPRQALLPVPYAIFANTSSNVLGALSATQLVGTVSSAQVMGNYSGAVNFTNGNDIYLGKFFGNGINLTNINGSMISTGTVADARLSGNVALLNTNQTFTGTNSFTSIYNSFSGSFFGNGLVGWIPVSNLTTQAVRDAGYMLLSPGLSTVTLPNSSILSGDIVRVSGAGKGGWLAKPNAGQYIIGNFASYANTYQFSSTSGNYSGVAAFAGGTSLYAVGAGITPISYSADAGKTWTSFSNLSGHWSSIACSANGHIIYVINTAGVVERSTNGGTIWTTLVASGATGSISCSPDGSVYSYNNVSFSGDGTYLGTYSGSTIGISTNSGANYFAIPSPGGTIGCLAVSSDCTRLVAGINNGLLYATANQGATWTTLTSSNQAWSGAYMSPDGSRFAATVSLNGVNGNVNYYGVDPMPNTISSNPICGSRGSAVELQFNGGTQFMPISSSGLIWAN